jgi:uncharacterized protein YqeY
MSLAEQIQTDLKTAMKARESDTVATLRMVLAGIKELRVAEGHEGEVTDDEVETLLARGAKQRREASAAYAEADRPELAEKEERELAVLERYLPEQLDQAQLERLVDEAIAESGAAGASDMGKVMQAVMPKVAGRADGKQVNALVRARLAS